MSACQVPRPVSDADEVPFLTPPRVDGIKGDGLSIVLYSLSAGLSPLNEIQGQRDTRN